MTAQEENSLPVSALIPDSDTEDKIVNFGTKIFEVIHNSQPSLFSKQFWSGRLLALSMAYPELKRELFRLVDVLPSLDSDIDIYKHVRSYISPNHINKISRIITPFYNWMMKGNQHNYIRSSTVAFIVRRAVQEMAAQFIAGNNPVDATDTLKKLQQHGLAFTVDLLGEYSLSEQESISYLNRYLECIRILTKNFNSTESTNHSTVCVSVKLSALYSQCSPLNFTRSVAILSERLGIIAELAQSLGASIYVDAEDSSTNPLIYSAFMNTFGNGPLRSFTRPGVVVQAYSKDSMSTLEMLHKFAIERENPIAIRLVKGAYWDHETMIAIQQGWVSPLLTQKWESDAQFERLSTYLLTHRDWMFPAFASHNIRSLSHACIRAQSLGISAKEFEIQTLFGMADSITKAFSHLGYLVRVYVPLGEMIPGMGYLIRRLLENTSNESFLRHTFTQKSNIKSLLASPHRHK
jgi:RHH-type proline utilization regulon transcriptional repressor/proline dehydrogenase/delta 1-pyrroline-5-carboxylate dehydrogenase